MQCRQELKNLMKSVRGVVAVAGPGDPLPPFERRIVHEYLRERGGVETHSEGNEPERYLVISPLAD